MFLWVLHVVAMRRRSSSFSNFRVVLQSKDYYNLDADIKSAVLKISSSVVSITTRTGENMLFVGSGTIIEYDQQGFATVLTSATLVRGPDGATLIPADLKIEVYLSDGKFYEGQVSFCDFHYNIATIKIKATTSLSTATFRYIDDSVTVDLRESVLVKHSTHLKLRPGDRVIALGRDCVDHHEVMASPGVFSAYDCRHDCKELFLTTCVVTKLAVGGPLINSNGEVIGVNFFICPFNVFIPINIVAKCLEDVKRNRQVARPWLGVQIANLYTADLEKLDKLYQEFPNVSGGVIIEQVVGKGNMGSRMRTKANHWTSLPVRNWFKAKALHENDRKRKRIKFITDKGDRTISRIKEWQRSSPASVSGLWAGDVIIKCGDVSVDSHLKFVEALWDKEGKLLELVLLRPGSGEQTVTLTVGSFPEMPGWYL
ncbi:hypothetical protein RND81_14G140900 [Saponaria officinalis]|uniref:PDZ domain-containing protein n=1 Tax=Saponaria officinalis TaxID=3572 RepID=A0AAW1GLN7_SAPOF